ncbi:MAG: hypothetical protein KAR20_12120, partial [Candidatus Heimdallarchaeota archaeon]|nr:hypothetical protein [Candidatus Heimdallarchaeota archaeon]
MGIESKFGYFPVASMEEDHPDFNRILEIYKPLFESKRGVKINEKVKELPSVFFIMTGGTEQKVLDLISKNNIDQDVFLLAHPGNNSLPASLEILAYLQQEGKGGQVFYLNGTKDNNAIKKLLLRLKFDSVDLQMKTTRIGLFGKPSDWLIASKPNVEVVRKNWGPEGIEIGMDQLQTEISHASVSSHQNDITRFLAGAREIDGLPGDDFKKSFLIFDALNKQIKKQNLDSVSVRCFDLVTDLEVTGCVALAYLNDHGNVAGCEGDLNATIAMLWVQKLLGEISWMANPAQINQKENKLWLAHCTIACSMVKSYNLLTHFESDLGIGIQGELAKGPCTLIRIGGKDLKQIWIAEGKIIQSGKAENLCRTQAEIQLKDKNDLD